VAALELIRHQDIGEGWREVQCAINGTLAVPFSFHRSQVEGMTAEAYMAFLERNAMAMLEQFGDARAWPEQGRKEVDIQ
jgi:hypothetical protein